jgi:hypothetical protein
MGWVLGWGLVGLKRGQYLILRLVGILSLHLPLRLQLTRLKFKFCRDFPIFPIFRMHSTTVGSGITGASLLIFPRLCANGAACDGVLCRALGARVDQEGSAQK